MPLTDYIHLPLIVFLKILKSIYWLLVQNKSCCTRPNLHARKCILFLGNCDNFLSNECTETGYLIVSSFSECSTNLRQSAQFH